VNLSCEMARSRLGGYAAETLGAEERRAVRGHLEDCPSCFEEAAATDATLLFVRAGSEEAPAEEVARVLSAVKAGIALKTLERRLGPPASRRPVASLAAVATGIVLLLALPGSLSDRQPSAPEVSGARPGEAPAGDTPWPAAAPGDFERLGLESGFPAEATVYDWTPGGEQPRVVWIVDRSLDI